MLYVTFFSVCQFLVISIPRIGSCICYHLWKEPCPVFNVPPLYHWFKVGFPFLLPASTLPSYSPCSLGGNSWVQGGPCGGVECNWRQTVQRVEADVSLLVSHWCLIGHPHLPPLLLLLPAPFHSGILALLSQAQIFPGRQAGWFQGNCCICCQLLPSSLVTKKRLVYTVMSVNVQGGLEGWERQLLCKQGTERWLKSWRTHSVAFCVRHCTIYEIWDGSITGVELTSGGGDAAHQEWLSIPSRILWLGEGQKVPTQWEAYQCFGKAKRELPAIIMPGMRLMGALEESWQQLLSENMSRSGHSWAIQSELPEICLLLIVLHEAQGTAAWEFSFSAPQTHTGQF